MIKPRLTRTSTDITNIRRELRWTVFEVTLSLVRRTNDRQVFVDVADNLDRLSKRFRFMAKPNGNSRSERR